MNNIIHTTSKIYKFIVTYLVGLSLLNVFFFTLRKHRTETSIRNTEAIYHGALQFQGIHRFTK